MECDKCNKIFKTKQKLNNHINRKIKCDNKITCKHCDKEFKTKQLLKQHHETKKNCQTIKLENTLERVELKNKVTQLKDKYEIEKLEMQN